MSFISSGSESILFPDNHFEVVCSFNSLDHVDDLDKTIKEIFRVVKKGGLFLLLTDVNHEPTPCEPITFSWDISSRFTPTFEILDERKFEKKAGGLYQSINAKIPYDDEDASDRYGILPVKFKKNKFSVKINQREVSLLLWRPPCLFSEKSEFCADPNMSRASRYKSRPIVKV